MKTKSPARFYYFGVWDGLGHFLRDRHGRSHDVYETPWGYEIDSRLCPETEAPCLGMGIPTSKLTHKDGWTALAFWDRTGDKRGKSNSAFVADEIMTAPQMLAAAEAMFPTIWRRLHKNLRSAPP